MKLRQTLFWDTNLKNIDLQKHARYIIERVADFGHDDEVKWVFHFYDKSLIKETIEKSRCLRAETKNLWMSL